MTDDEDSDTNDSGSEDEQTERERDLAELGTPEEELLPLGIPVADDLDMQLGYDNSTGFEAGGSGEYVGFWIIGEQLMITDGYSTSDGNTRAFMNWDRDAGVKFLRLMAEKSDEHSVENVPDKVAAPSLSTLLEEEGYSIGSPRGPGDSAFLLNTKQNRLFVGGRSKVSLLCERQNKPPEIVEELPDDPEEAAAVFSEALSRVGKGR